MTASELTADAAKVISSIIDLALHSNDQLVKEYDALADAIANASRRQSVIVSLLRERLAQPKSA